MTTNLGDSSGSPCQVWNFHFRIRLDALGSSDPEYLGLVANDNVLPGASITSEAGRTP